MKQVLMIGDSTFRGWGAGDTDYYVNSRAGCLPTKLAEALSAQGVSAAAESRVGSGNWSNTELVASDPAIDLGGWYLFNTGPGVGGELFAYSGTSMTIDFVGDTVKVLACGYPGNSMMRLRVDGGAWQLFDLNVAATTLQVVDVPVASSGAHTIEIDKDIGGGDAVYHCGILAYDSSDAASIVNISANGYQALSYLSTGFPWTAYDAMPAITGDVVVFNTGINDVLGGVSQVDYESRYTQFIDEIKLINPAASIYFVIPNDISSGLGYVPAAVTSLATTHGATVIDSRQAAGFADYATANAAGLMYDDYHPSPSGCIVLAGHYASILAAEFPSGGSTASDSRLSFSFALEL